MGQIVLARSDIDLSEPTIEIAQPFLSEPADDDPMDVDGDAKRKTDEMYVPPSLPLEYTSNIPITTLSR